jgi:peptidoglycan/xylan/chitin deacetylase (PgdA/CDA1 family)
MFTPTPETIGHGISALSADLLTVSTVVPALAVTGATLTIAGLAWGAFSYASRWPASQLFGPTLIAPEKPNELALTYDDGPNPEWTPQLLEILARQNIRATFFLIGSYAARQPALVRQIAAAGHVIGNHSWHHPNLALTPAARVRNELTRAKTTIEAIIGKEIHLFRPPFGARRPAVLRIARSLGLTPVMWNAMTNDWSNPDPESIASNLIAKIERNQQSGMASNIVLHDGSHMDPEAERGPSITATKRIISQFKKTRHFVTLDKWIS